MQLVDLRLRGNGGAVEESGNVAAAGAGAVAAGGFEGVMNAEGDEGLKENGRGGVGDDLHGVGIDGVYFLDGGSEVLQQGSAADLYCVDYVLCGEVGAVMERDSLSEVERPCEVVVSDGS